MREREKVSQRELHRILDFAFVETYPCAARSVSPVSLTGLPDSGL
jgi:hypothetical protein